LYSTKTHPFAGVHPPRAKPPDPRAEITPRTAESCSAAHQELGVSVTQQSINREMGKRMSAKVWHESCCHREVPGETGKMELGHQNSQIGSHSSTKPSLENAAR